MALKITANELAKAVAEATRNVSRRDMVLEAARTRWQGISLTVKDNNWTIFSDNTAWNAATAAQKADALRLMILLVLVLIAPKLKG